MFTGAFELPELPPWDSCGEFIARWLTSRGLEVKFNVAYLQRIIREQFGLIPARFVPFLRFPRKQEYQMKILAALIASLERDPPNESLADVSERSLKCDMSISRTHMSNEFCGFIWATFEPFGLDVGTFTRACAAISPLLCDDQQVQVGPNEFVRASCDRVAYLVPDDVAEDLPPDDGAGDLPPDDGAGDLPPDDGVEDLPPDDGAEDLPPDDGAEDLPPDDGERGGQPMAGDGGVVDPFDDGGRLWYGCAASWLGDAVGEYDDFFFCWF